MSACVGQRLKYGETPEERHKIFLVETSMSELPCSSPSVARVVLYLHFIF